MIAILARVGFTSRSMRVLFNIRAEIREQRLAKALEDLALLNSKRQ
jgi:hypothetical protein